MPRLPLLLPRELDPSDCEEEPLIPSLDRLDEPLMPDELELPRDDELELDDELRLRSLEPDALMPSSLLDRSLLELERSLLELDEPFDDALRPPWPERSCELPRPELVLPEAPRPSFRLFESPIVLELRSLPLVLLLSDDVPLRLLDAP